MKFSISVAERSGDKFQALTESRGHEPQSQQTHHCSRVHRGEGIRLEVRISVRNFHDSSSEMATDLRSSEKEVF